MGGIMSGWGSNKHVHACMHTHMLNMIISIANCWPCRKGVSPGNSHYDIIAYTQAYVFVHVHACKGGLMCGWVGGPKSQEIE